MTDTITQIGLGAVAIVLLIVLLLAVSVVVGGLLGASVALAYNLLFAASFKVLPAAYTGSIVSVAATGVAVGIEREARRR